MIDLAYGSSCRFENSAERLVLFGYRNYCYGYARHSELHILESWAVHTKYLDNILQAKEVFNALVLFAQVLSNCTKCPFKSKPDKAHSVTRDEGLTSAIQNGDEHVRQRCLEQLTCKSRCWELAHAAEQYAVILRSLDQKLQPIPMNLIEQLLTLNPLITIH